MQDKAERNRIAVNIWTARIIPIVLAGVVGYATYVLVALLCGRLSPWFLASLMMDLLN
jgi:palmitoyltransferase